MGCFCLPQKDFECNKLVKVEVSFSITWIQQLVTKGECKKCSRSTYFHLCKECTWLETKKTPTYLASLVHCAPQIPGPGCKSLVWWTHILFTLFSCATSLPRVDRLHKKVFPDWWWPPRAASSIHILWTRPNKWCHKTNSNRAFLRKLKKHWWDSQSSKGHCLDFS